MHRQVLHLRRGARRRGNHGPIDLRGGGGRASNRSVSGLSKRRFIRCRLQNQSSSTAAAAGSSSTAGPRTHRGSSGWSLMDTASTRAGTATSPNAWSPKERPYTRLTSKVMVSHKATELDLTLSTH